MSVLASAVNKVLAVAGALAVVITLAAGVALAQTPPPVPSAGPQVFLVENGAQSGPFTVDQVKQKIAARQVSRETLAWIDGMANWAPAGQVPQLAGLFDSNTPPPPPEPRDAKAFLHGKWVSDPIQVPVQGVGTGNANGWAEYDQIGGVKGELVVTAPYLNGQMTVTIQSTMQGTYTAQAQGADKIELTINGTMKTEMRSTGSNVPAAPQLEQINNTQVLTILDQNTVRDALGNISRRVQ